MNESRKFLALSDKKAKYHTLGKTLRLLYPKYNLFKFPKSEIESGMAES